MPINFIQRPGGATLDGVQRFGQSLTRLFGMKGGSMATVASPVLAPTVQVNDPTEATQRFARGEKLWSFGVNQTLTIGDAGCNLTVGLPSTIVDYFSVITGVRATIDTSGAPPAAAILTASVGSPVAGAAGALFGFYQDGRAHITAGVGAACQTKFSSVGTLAAGFLASPLALLEFVGNTATLTSTSVVAFDYARALPITVIPGQIANFAIAWNVVTTTSSFVSFQVQGFERLCDPNETLADGNVL